jgi:hypothetical protein
MVDMELLLLMLGTVNVDVSSGLLRSDNGSKEIQYIVSMALVQKQGSRGKEFGIVYSSRESRAVIQYDCNVARM